MFVYVISANEKRHKIGVAAKPEGRLRALQTGSHEDLRLTYVQSCDDAYRVEQIAHDSLSKFHVQGEWFDCSENQAISMVGAALVNHELAPDPEFAAFGGWNHLVGDVVECRNSGEPWLRGPLPVPGRFYTVCAIYDGGAVDVAEVQNEDIAMCRSMFWPARHRLFVA